MMKAITGARDQRRDGLRIAEHAGLREIEAFRVLPGAEHQRGECQPGDIGQHQADQNFVHAEPGAQKSRDGGPGHAAGNARKAHQRQNPEPVLAPERERHAAAGDRAHGQLALGADVPHIGAEAGRQAHGHHRQRAGFQCQFGQPVGGEQRRDEEGIQRQGRLGTDGGEDQRAGNHGGADRQHRREPGQPARDGAAGFDSNAHGMPAATKA